MTEEQKNRDFVMFYRPFMDAITDMAGQNYTAYKLFKLLCKHMDGYNALCVSNIALSELLETTTRTVQRAVKYLKENGWIDVLKSGTSNVYIVNSDVAWTSYSNQKQYCKFNGTFLLSASENNEFLNNPKATTHYKGIDTEFVKSVMNKQEEFEKECKSYKESEEKNNIPGQIELEDIIPKKTKKGARA